MDLTDFLRVCVTVSGFVCFLAIVLWAYGKPAQDGFNAAANQPIEDDDSTADLGVNVK
ncbi:MAG: CcoQ/FixQ family Cbb3-type cytochrome c oxidase assembly chaperone [Burkholderiales bacterium]|nr:CcoQ/FixQ family Cbb3-type cytochrome c oxidase assembly chaperone [Burkholderiales bacterium]